MSNFAINLTPNKDRIFKEAYSVFEDVGIEDVDIFHRGGAS